MNIIMIQLIQDVIEVILRPDLINSDQINILENAFVCGQHLSIDRSIY